MVRASGDRFKRLESPVDPGRAFVAVHCRALRV